MASRPIDDLLRDVLTCVRLRRPIAAFGFDGEPGAGEPWATYVQPGVDAWETCGHQYYFGFEERERIVAAGGGHRVLVRTGGSDLEIMALLRHELRPTPSSTNTTRTSTSSPAFLRRACSRCMAIRLRSARFMQLSPQSEMPMRPQGTS